MSANSRIRTCGHKNLKRKIARKCRTIFGYQQPIPRGATVSSYAPIHFKAVLIRGAVAMALVIGPGASFGAKAADHYISLTNIFPSGKCSPVVPNFEVMISRFAGGEITEHKIHNDQDEVIEVITTFINKERDQWATVGSRRDTKVIFCLYASGNGRGSVNRRILESE